MSPPSTPVGGTAATGATVDSRWWYAVAATPAYVVVSTLVGVLFVGTVLLGLGFGLPRLATFALVALLAGVPGLALAVLFPLGLYLDAEAVGDANVGWEPDPALYAVLGVVAVVVTAFVGAFPLALYYLYRRHRAVGVP